VQKKLTKSVQKKLASTVKFYASFKVESSRVNINIG